MRVAVIGYGGWGKIHASCIASYSSHTLAAIVTRTEESASRASSDFPSVDTRTRLDDVLNRRDIDVVDIVLPTYLHVPLAIKALEAGKHVILEKPLAGTVEECDTLLEAAGKSGRVVTLVHELRCSEQWKGIRDLIQAGKIGTPRYGLFNLFRFPYRKGSEGWRYRKEQVGSWVLEEPIHFIDLMLWYFQEAGKPTAVSGWGTMSPEGLVQDFTAVFEFSHGGYCVVTQTLSGFQHHQVVEVTGTEGSLRSLWSGAMDRTDTPEFSLTAQLRGETAASPVRLKEKSGELFEIRRYLELALDGIERSVSLYPPEEERELVRLCLEAERSIATRNRIVL